MSAFTKDHFRQVLHVVYQRANPGTWNDLPDFDIKINGNKGIVRLNRKQVGDFSDAIYPFVGGAVIEITLSVKGKDTLSGKVRIRCTPPPDETIDM